MRKKSYKIIKVKVFTSFPAEAIWTEKNKKKQMLQLLDEVEHDSVSYRGRDCII